ncbi:MULTISPECIES: hypothetical protein [unclassified Streptomyces]|uniref:hypothetical protein n=1 Tax=unclassified Streptomyces TaxID=2593676 RepID=UPI002E290444|nr:hypothetical protein [Streptomyces sp. NBC_00228]
MNEIWAALVGGVMAMVAGLGGIAWQSRVQRELAHADRMWGRRAELYVEILRHDDATMLPGGGVPADVDPPNDPKLIELRKELAARVDAFASVSVRDLWLDAQRRDQDLIDASAQAFGGGMPDHEFDRVVEQLPETATLRAARLRLRTQIRAELDPAGRPA